MTNKEMRLAIAELAGWEPEHTLFKGAVSDYLPNWPEDLNEMHKLEMALPDDNSLHGRVAYRNILFSICGTQVACFTASAEQRAFAYLRLFGMDQGVKV